MLAETLSQDALDLVRDVVLDDVRRFGATAVDVTVGPDHDGEPSLQVDVSYTGDGEPIDPKVVAALLSKLRDQLWRLGEDRFPYIRHHFPEHQKVVGVR